MQSIATFLTGTATGTTGITGITDYIKNDDSGENASIEIDDFAG